MMKRFGMFFAVLVAALFGMFGFGLDNDCAAANDVIATLSSGPNGFAGRASGHAKAMAAKASTVTPVTEIDPIPTIAGQVVIYNAADNPAENVLIRLTSWRHGVRKRTDFRAGVDGRDNIVLDLEDWNTHYRVALFEDVDSNGRLTKVDRRVKQLRGRTHSKKWVRRHNGETPIFDVVIFGTGEGNPPTTDGYRSYVSKQGDFGFVAAQYAAAFYGKDVTIETELVAIGDQSATPTIVETATMMVTAPASGSSPSVFVTTSGATATAPAGHATGEFGVVLTSTGRQIYQIWIYETGTARTTGQTFTFWHN